MDVLIALAAMTLLGLALRFTIYRSVVARDRRVREYRQLMEAVSRAYTTAATKMRWLSRRRRKDVEEARWDDLFEGSLDFPRSPPRVAYSTVLDKPDPVPVEVDAQIEVKHG